MGRIDPKEVTLKDGRKAVIRHAEKSDAESLLKLFDAIIAQDAYNVTTPADVEKMNMTIEKEEKFIEDHQKDGHLALVLQIDSNIAGLISINNGIKYRTAHVGTMGISVDRQYRQKGVATALLKAAIEWAQSDPLIEKVALGVLANHIVAINLYKKLGFVEEGRKVKEFKIAPGNYMDDILMYKFIK